MDWYNLIWRTRAVKKDTSRPSPMVFVELMLGQMPTPSSSHCTLHSVLLKNNVFTSMSLGEEAALLFGKHFWYWTIYRIAELTSCSLPCFRCLNLRDQLVLGERKEKGLSLFWTNRNAANFLKWNGMILSGAVSASDPTEQQCPPREANMPTTRPLWLPTADQGCWFCSM